VFSAVSPFDFSGQLLGIGLSRTFAWPERGDRQARHIAPCRGEGASRCLFGILWTGAFWKGIAPAIVFRRLSAVRKDPSKPFPCRGALQ
jgi:hypothetical protein